MQHLHQMLSTKSAKWAFVAHSMRLSRCSDVLCVAWRVYIQTISCVRYQSITCHPVAEKLLRCSTVESRLNHCNRSCSVAQPRHDDGRMFYDPYVLKLAIPPKVANGSFRDKHEEELFEPIQRELVSCGASQLCRKSIKFRRGGHNIVLKIVSHLTSPYI